jgi:hypothetical protein
MCGIACVLLIVLWVRSYKWNDYRYKCVYGMRALLLDSAHGQVAISTTLLPATFGSNWSESGSDDMDGTPGAIQRFTENKLGFAVMTDTNNFSVVLPHWFALALIATCAAAPWMQWSKRFSLRTLLIATTLVAMVLGLIVWR